jgi:N-methylhydantoinase A/oxoprolinase/acetone carboxylase beta subunit
VADVDPAEIRRMVFSTTMATNAVVQDSLPGTGMIVSAGPGMDPTWFSVGPSYHVVEGCLDHRGFEALPLNRKSVLDAAASIQKQSIETAGIVGKFSVRNPAHELQISKWVGSMFTHVALGHRVSGNLNFPRRIATTYLNAALHEVHHQFSTALKHILNEKNLHAPRYLLKPDGGTVELEKSEDSPARTIQSGPAASVMGALALDSATDTSLVLDIGGTSTDISVILKGVPLLEPFGIRLGPYKTLIRSLLTRSIGVGGDSEVRRERDGELRIGPKRQGPPLAFGGPTPTPTDAMITLGLLDAGNKDEAKRAMEILGGPVGWNAHITAERVLEFMAKTIADSANAFLSYINSRPVYTIHEVIEKQKIEPTSVVVIGGPARQVAGYVGKALDLPHRVPPYSGVANAIGAAVSRVTSELTLQADTERGTVLIPEEDIENQIDARFNLQDAIALAQSALRKRALEFGAEPETLDISVAEKQVFNMIRGFSKTGQNIRVKMCITPGIIPEWKRRH